jgi:hypothetical protein
MDLIEIIWDLSQQEEINRHEKQIMSGEAGLHSTRVDIRDLQSRMVKLAITCQALCDMMVDKLGVPPEEIKQAIEQRLKAESISEAAICPACDHRLHAGRTMCLYCGHKPAVAAT